MFYLEDVKSQQLYSLNRKRCLFERYAYKNGQCEKLFHYVYKIYSVMRCFMIKKYYDKVEAELSEYVPVKKYKYFKLPKTVIYTAIIGKYDELHEPFYTSDKYDFICITDNVNLCKRDSAWRIVYIEELEDKIPRKLNAMQINRWLKMHPHEIFPEYEVSMYIDGLVNVVTDMMPIILDFYESKKVLGIHLHYCRTKIITELNMLLHCNKITRKDKEQAMIQLDKYIKNGFDNSISLLEATVMIRKHNTELCKRLMIKWWEEFIYGIKRDQISLPYVIWNANLTMDDIYLLGDNEYANPRFYIDKHI